MIDKEDMQPKKGGDSGKATKLPSKVPSEPTQNPKKIEEENTNLI